MTNVETASIRRATALTRRPAAERGHVDLGWLKSAHTFSFGSYYDPKHVQFEALRVINDDEVVGGAGFPMHGHTDAEIFSYVLEGALAHEDTLGNGSTVGAGGVQYMSAGSGVRHSEFNPSETDTMRFLQIWLLPNETGASPKYDTLDISPEDKDGKFKLFLSKDGRDGSMHIRANADIYAATLSGAQALDYTLAPNHRGWVQVAKGELIVNGVELKRGDGLAIEDHGVVEFRSGQNAEIIFFDLERQAI